jgi:hypothetical protein
MGQTPAAGETRSSIGRLLLRAGLVHPALLIGPWVVMAQILAHLPGSELDDVGWIWAPIVLGALASIAVTAVMAILRADSPGAVGLLLATAVAAAVVVGLAGLYGWLLASGVACHGRYECPL